MARKPYISTLLIALIALVALAACGGPQASPTATTQSSTSGDTSAPTNTSAPAATEAQPTSEPTAEATAEATSEAEVPTEESPAGGTLTVYSGRSEELVGPLIEQFEQETGVDVEVKYGDTAELAAALLEEGDASPADVYFAQDAGALGAVSSAGLLAPLSEDLLSSVEERFRADDGTWVGVSGRARVVVYNPDMVSEDELPNTIFGFTDPRWKGQLGWAPTNGSFQAFVTALRVLEGDERAREWLEGIQANEPKVYPKNSAIVQAVASGEIAAGFVNHYYLFAEMRSNPEIKAQNFYLQNGDPGALINVAGVGVLQSSDQQELARQFVEYLLSEQGQQYFAQNTFEYPLIEGVEPSAELPALSEIQTPDLDLSDLEDLDGTLQLLQDAGIL